VPSQDNQFVVAEQVETNIAATSSAASTSISALRQRAESGDDDAMLHLAHKILEKKDSSPEERFDEAIVWLEKAANLGNAEAQCEMADALRALDDFSGAFDWDQKAAKQGWANSQYNLGVCCRDGIGTSKNPEMQFYWYGQAANNGVTEAKLSYAICFILGVGTPQDFEQAVYWMRQAADEGNAEAKMRLGTAYIQGIGCPVDTKGGISLLREASSLGNEKAKELLNSQEVRSIIKQCGGAGTSVNRPPVSGKLIVLIVGGAIGALFGGVCGATEGAGGFFGGLLGGGYFGIGIGTFMGFVNTELGEIWGFFKFNYDEEHNLKESLLFSLVLLLIWRVPKLAVLFFISPLIAIYRLMADE